jgi:hypothetical protein
MAPERAASARRLDSTGRTAADESRAVGAKAAGDSSPLAASASALAIRGETTRSGTGRSVNGRRDRGRRVIGLFGPDSRHRLLSSWPRRFVANQQVAGTIWR